MHYNISFHAVCLLSLISTCVFSRLFSLDYFFLCVSSSFCSFVLFFKYVMKKVAAKKGGNA